MFIKYALEEEMWIFVYVLIFFLVSVEILFRIRITSQKHFFATDLLSYINEYTIKYNISYANSAPS